MAIKTISQLDQFNNGEASQYIDIVGGNMRLYADIGRSAGDLVAKESHGAKLEELSTTYRHSLFEISQPQITDRSKNEFFYSKHIPYFDMVKNIIADTKQYLNAHNGLFDNDLETIAHDDYTFTGHKIFAFGGASRQGQGNGGVEILCGLTADLVNITNGLTCTVPGNTRPILFDASLSVRHDVSCANIFGQNLYGKDISCANLTASTYGQFDNKLKVGLTAELPSLTSTLSGVSISGGITLSNILTADNTSIRLSRHLITNNNNINAGSGNISCNVLYGAAMSAYWADLAEFYAADKKYEPGTLVKFGGEREITEATDEANAVISQNPALVMNSQMSEDEFSCPIAFEGRVPVKVVGKVSKFSKIVLSDIPGVARALDKKPSIEDDILGIALQANDREGIKLVECVVKLRL